MLQRPEEPFREMQLDTFFLPNTSAAQGRARELQREGVSSGASSALRRVLVAVDVTSRTLDARMLSAQELSPRGFPVRTAKAAASMLRPYVDTLQRITTDDGNEFTDLFQSNSRDCSFSVYPKRDSPKPIRVNLPLWKQQYAAYENTWKNTDVCTRIPIIPSQMDSTTLYPLLIVPRTRHSYSDTP
jgi:hypothetical protein